MKVQSFIFALLGLMAVSDAATIARRSPFERALRRRQFGGGGRGGFNGGNNFNNGNQNQGQNQDQTQDDTTQDDTTQDDSDQTNDDDNNNNNDDSGDSSTTLDSNNIQTGSQQDGNQEPTDGQSASATDDANFINFCTGETLTNGEQNQQGSCNGIPMGKIPSTSNMVSSVFVSPQNGDNVDENQDFDIQIQMQGLAAGTFTNAQTTYYSAPQDLDGSGQIIGHTHITVQDTGNSLNPTTPLDPTQFAFFKGINDDGNGQGLLAATVDGGLPAGNYRICSMSSAANHQPVLMPVAQRGAQDDCIRVTVGGNNNNDNNNGDDDNANADDTTDDTNDNTNDNGNQNNGNQNNGGNNGFRPRRGRGRGRGRS